MKIVGSFCERVVTPLKKIDRRSLRWKKSGKAWVRVGCPRGKWQARKQLCSVGTKANVVLVPTRLKRCHTGQKRITKG